jgi:hypothetical protein
MHVGSRFRRLRMSPLPRGLYKVCAAILMSAPLGVLAQGVVIGQGLVKTDAGEFVRSAGQTWACLDAEWKDEGRAPGGPGTRYSCAGTIVDSGTYTAVSSARTAVALADIKEELDGVAANVARNTELAEALHNQIEAQLRSSNKLLYETIRARFDAVPAQVLTNKAFKGALAKLEADILAAVRANGMQPFSSRP